jgi:hypothetical protein
VQLLKNFPIFMETKSRCRIHKSAPLVRILMQANPVHPNMILLPFPPASYMHSSSVHTCYLPCPSHPSLLYHLNCMYLGKSTSYEFPHYASFPTFLSFHPSSGQLFSLASCSQALSTSSSLIVRNQVSNQSRTTGNIIDSYTLLLPC